MRLSLAAGLLLLAIRGALAADPLVLEQSVPDDKAGRPLLMIDRASITSVVVEKGQDLNHRLSITFLPETRPRFVIQCANAASAREVVEALRQGGPPHVDLTARCHF